MITEKDEPTLVILVVDGRQRYINERIVRVPGETPEAFADRVRARLARVMLGVCD